MSNGQHEGFDPGLDPEFQEETMRGLGHGPIEPVKLRHPRGLWVLFITEMWERFSYYGMRALLVLYLIQSSDKIEPNPGFGWTDDSAYFLYGIYTWAVYLTPIFGGLLADRLLGTHRSMLIGGWIIAAGHICLACTEFFGITAGEAVTLQTGSGALLMFMTGLFLIVIGTGFFKPCVSVMVGQLYEENDPRRDSGFTIFYMGINLGAFFSPLVAGTLGETVGWHWGFGSAAVGMLAGLFFYQVFRPRYLKGIGLSPKAQAQWDAEKAREEPEQASKPEQPHHGLTRIEWQRIGVILILAFLGNIAFWTAFEQAGSSMNVFAARETDRTIGGTLIADDLNMEVRLASETPADQTFTLTHDGASAAQITLGTTTAAQLANDIRSISAFASLDIKIETTNDGGVDAPIAPNDLLSLTMNDAFRTFFPDATPADLIRRELEPPFTLVPVIGGDEAGGDDADPDSWALVDVLENQGFPATWYQSVNPLAIILFAPVFAWLWVFLQGRGLNPSTPMKFSIGLWLLGLAFIATVLGAMETRDGGLAAFHWLAITYLVITWGELCLSPVGLSMVTKLAPRRLQSLMMGLWFFSFSLSNLLAGVVVAPFSTKFIPNVETGEPAQWTFFIEGLAGFFLLLVVIPILVGFIIMVLSPMLKRMMHGVQ